MPNTPKHDRNELIQCVRVLLGDHIEEELKLDGSLELRGGDPSEVIVRIGVNKVSVSEFTVRWDGPHTPTVKPRLVMSLNLKRLPKDDVLRLLEMSIDSTRRARLAKYRKCLKCGETNPPEWMHDDKNCQSCAQQHMGVVY